MELASKIRAEREQEFKESMLGYRLKKDRTVNFLDYYQAYINSYTKKDIRMVQIALSRFKDFLKEKYPMNECSIKPKLITKEMMEQFVAYLMAHDFACKVYSEQDGTNGRCWKWQQKRPRSTHEGRYHCCH